MRLIRLIVLSIMLISPILGKSQDTICVELNDYREILKLANKGYFCDSLIIYYDSTLQTNKHIIDQKNDQILIADQLITSQRGTIKKLKLHRTLLFSGLGICVLSILALLL